MLNPKSILIVKTSAIGDIIHTFPVVEYLSKSFPDAKIDWVVEKGCYGLVNAHPNVDTVLSIDTKNWKERLSIASLFQIKDSYQKISEKKYDVLFDLQGNIKSGFITSFASAKYKVGFGKGSVHEMPNLLATRTRFQVELNQNVRLRYLELVQQFFGDERPFELQGVKLRLLPEEKAKKNEIISSFAKEGPLIMVCFGSKWSSKRLDEKTLVEFLKRVYGQLNPFFVFVFGNIEEQHVANSLHAEFPRSKTLGQITLPLWQSLMYEMDAVIAMDSAALHLCGTTTTPSFSVFGPSSSLIYKPLGNHHSLQGTCPYDKKFVDRCPILRSCPTAACMKALPPQNLSEEFLSFWKQKK